MYAIKIPFLYSHSNAFEMNGIGSATHRIPQNTAIQPITRPQPDFD